MKWIDAADLDRWADRLDCRSRLPEILRRLIYASVNSPTRVDFPSGESTQSGGWDGILETTEAISPIPKGTSGWEISVRQDTTTKANEDYEKRTADALGLRPTEVTFVFATPRKWSQKRAWEAQKRDEGVWKDVRALDADDLEQWLDLHEAVSAPLATAIGKYPEGVQGLEDYWLGYSHSTQPPIPTEMMLASRGAELEKVRQWLDEPPALLYVHADSEDEAVAFLAAAVLTCDHERKDLYLSRTLIGTGTDTLRNLSLSATKPLKLVWLAEDHSAVAAAVARGQHVLIPVALTIQASSEGGIILPRAKKEEFRKALESTGLSQEESTTLTKETGSRISVFRRRAATLPTAAQPEWATPEIGYLLLPALLAGAWAEGTNGDREVLGQLAGTSYEEFATRVPRLAGGADTPFRRIGEAWTLAAPIDAWYLLAPYLTRDHLQTFETVCVNVLGTKHPKLSLEPSERWMASIHGKNLPHSEWLREGLAHTLILLIVVGQKRALQTSRRPADTTDAVVRRLLGEEATWEVWYSLSGLLPLLAEASPERFLESVEDALEQDPSRVLALFDEERGGISPTYHHTGLLWALEVLAWSEAYLGRVTRILGKLARLDPGVKIQNKPKNTLRSIFLPWLPQTGASLANRLSALDILVEREPDIAWEVLLELLPKDSDHTGRNAEPRWRERPTKLGVTNAEYFETVDALCTRVITLLDASGSRLAELVTHLTSLPPKRRQEAISKFQQLADSTSDRQKVWGQLRGVVHHHRKFQDSEWSLPPKELDGLSEILKKLEPEDVVTRSVFLFDDWWPEIPNPVPVNSGSYQVQEKQIDKARAQAVRNIAASRGLEGLHALARCSKNPEWVGRWVGKSLEDQRVEENALNALGVSEEAIRQFSMGFVSGRAMLKGDAWIESILCSEDWGEWEPAEAANFCLSLGSSRPIWDRLSEKGEEADKLYWSVVWPRVSGGESTANVEHAIEKLMYGGQFGRAVLFADQFRSDVRPALLIEALNRLHDSIAKGETSISRESLDYHIEQVLALLQASPDLDESEVAKLEWKYLSLLRWRKQPLVLHRVLSRDPTFFVDLIKWVFKARGSGTEEEDLDEAAELIEHRARVSYELLSGWKRIPGMADDGSIDAAHLHDWVNTARKLCRESDRAAVGDQQIGRLLAYAPGDADGAWPHRVVRDLIESIESRDLEKGVEIGVYNKRGVTTRLPDTGGGPERELAAGYREAAESARQRWPRVAAMLDRIAEVYESEGRREDDQSDEFEARG